MLFNPFEGVVYAAQVFDTYKSSDNLDAFIHSSLPEGFIVIVACKDECTTSLSEIAREWLRSMGSKDV